MSDQKYPYDIDDTVAILSSTVVGQVVSVTLSAHHDALYLIEYLDTNGNPQQGRWHHDQLTLADPNPAEYQADNVVPLRATHH